MPAAAATSPQKTGMVLRIRQPTYPYRAPESSRVVFGRRR
ncbi:hypothetical protein CGLO_00714 [Colletotrichum gloeosporioides Cg-14]|uniref:Uncharacterized protein n=1 Tax=Colletotrichum gloeosporioides (strain Cg-14) TaxID=1237896 RepID=T0KTY7_COLGC|nr:hypothetical protein CGLO_00714 [Colletotrichum gloeosporioides Cg-14]